ncbi:hypothetical protein [Actimicrobium antarcticum]|uniref:Uncharacterized protein n=1 Tax=Actimicrobium antarcticum TaxID=1051899 RepID=A0ABP7SGU3_9BURK
MAPPISRNLFTPTLPSIQEEKEATGSASAAKTNNASALHVKAADTPQPILTASPEDQAKVSTQAAALPEDGKAAVSNVSGVYANKFASLVNKVIQLGPKQTSTGHVALPEKGQQHESIGYPAGPANGKANHGQVPGIAVGGPGQFPSQDYTVPSQQTIPASPGPEKKMFSAIRKAFPKIAIIGGSMIAGFVVGHVVAGLATVFLGPLLGSLLGIGAGMATTQKLMQFANAHATEAEDNVDQEMSGPGEGEPYEAPHVQPAIGYPAGKYHGPKPAGYPTI